MKKILGIKILLVIKVAIFKFSSRKILFVSSIFLYRNNISCFIFRPYVYVAGAGHFVKMVHNGIEYGIMQAYAEGFNILHEANAGSKYVKEGDAEVAPMDNPEDYCYDIDVPEVAELWRRGSVVGSWLLDLTADVLRHDPKLSKFDGGVSDSGEGRWTLHAAVDLGVPTPVISAALFERFNSRRLGEFGNKILNGMRYMFGGHHVR